jgi:predicted nucleotidyltransferase
MGIEPPATRPPPEPDVNVADALFTRTQQRVLGLLFGNPARGFCANAVIALARAGSGAVPRARARLDGAGLVTVTRVGNQNHYQANARSPVFAELRGLVLTTSGVADVLREALAPVATKIHVAFVYGSLAHGTEKAGSDVDVMVVSDTLEYPELFLATEAATARLGRSVNPTIYTRDELRRRRETDNAFIHRVFGGPRIWIVGDENDLGV